MKSFDHSNQTLGADVAEVSGMIVRALSILAVACASAIGFLDTVVR